jgi:hypothetical protein
MVQKKTGEWCLQDGTCSWEGALSMLSVVTFVSSDSASSMSRLFKHTHFTLCTTRHVLTAAGMAALLY